MSPPHNRANPDRAHRPAPAAPREFVAFRAGGQSFCIDIMAVREIRGWTPATALPHAPAYVRGVINLRGAVLSIVDLAARLGLAATAPGPRHVVIVAEVGAQIVGLLVEAVSDILTVDTALIQPTPDVASAMTRDFVRGVLSVEGRMIGLIGLDNLMPAFDRAAA